MTSRRLPCISEPAAFVVLDKAADLHVAARKHGLEVVVFGPADRVAGLATWALQAGHLITANQPEGAHL